VSTNRERARQLKEKDEQHRHAIRRRAITWVLCLVAALCVLWVGGVVWLRQHMDLPTAVARDLPGTVAVPANSLQPATLSGTAFSAFDLTDAEHAGVGSAYVVDVPNPYASTVLGRLLGVPKVATMGVVVDRNFSITRMWFLNPRNPVPGPGGTREFLARWTGTSMVDLLKSRTPFILTGVGRLASPVYLRMKSLAGAVVWHELGKASYTATLSTARVQTLTLGEALPPFEAMAMNGDYLSSVTLGGRNTLLISAAPQCGSCFDAVVKVLEKFQGARVGTWNIVVFVLAPLDVDPSVALLKQLPPYSVVVPDQEQLIVPTIGMDDSPYVVMLDAEGVVRFRSQGYDDTSLLETMRALQQ
jgi:hypothetical protein